MHNLATYSAEQQFFRELESVPCAAPALQIWGVFAGLRERQRVKINRSRWAQSFCCFDKAFTDPMHVALIYNFV